MILVEKARTVIEDLNIPFVGIEDFFQQLKKPNLTAQAMKRTAKY